MKVFKKESTVPVVLSALVLVALVIAALVLFTREDRSDDNIRANYKQWEAKCSKMHGFPLNEKNQILCVDKKRQILMVWNGPVWPFHEDGPGQ